MYPSKSLTPIWSLLLGAFLSLGLAGCQLPTPQKTEMDDTASYFIFTSNGKFTSTTNYKNISLPQSRTLNFIVCLKENNHSRDVINHAFLIKGGPREQKISTDAMGCLIWNEEMAFNYLANERFINIERTISPLGQQKGDRRVELIVNPWSELVYSPLDSRVSNPVPAAQAKVSLMGTEQKDRRSLWLDWVRVNVMQDKIVGNKGTYNIEVSATLLAERIDDKNERLLVPLTYGKIVSRIQLICTVTPANKQAPVRIVLAQMDDVKAEVKQGGRVFLNSQFTLTEFCPSTAYLMAGLMVRVPDAPPLLSPFQGLYHGGPAQNMVGQMFSVADGTFLDRFNKDRNYSVGTYLAENNAIYRNGTRPLPTVNAMGEVVEVPERALLAAARTDKEIGNKTPEMMQRFGINIREINAKIIGIPKQSSKNRNLEFRVTVCPRLGIDSTPLRSVDFIVTRLNGKEDKVTTLDDGCFQFDDQISYNHFDRECWFERDLRIQAPVYGYNEVFKIHINPWNRTSSWYQDMRWLPQRDQVARCAPRDSQILLDYYFLDYSTNPYQYSLDEYLNLNQERVGNVTIRPLLSRGSFDSLAGYVNEPLPAGRYLLRYALVDQSVTEFDNPGSLSQRIYSVGRSVVNIREDGAITDRVRILLNNESLISLGLLNQFILELVPLKEGVELSPETRGAALEAFVDRQHAIQSVPFVAGFVARAEGGGLRKMDEYAGRSLVLELEKTYARDRYQREQTMKTLAKKESFAKINGLSIVNLNDEAQSLAFRQRLSQSLHNSLPNMTPSRAQANPNTTPVPLANLNNLLQTGTPDRALAVRLCGYIFGTLWGQNVPQTNHSYLDTTEASQVKGKLYNLQRECISLFDRAASEAFDIEYKYIVKNPKLVPLERCATDANGAPRCVKENAPERFDSRAFVVYNNASLSRSNTISDVLQGEVAGKAGLDFLKFFGIGGGLGYGVSNSDDRSQANTVGLVQDLVLISETLRFKVRAEDAERCLMVRLNPVLFDREEGSRLWSLFAEKQKSMFLQALHPELSEADRQKVRQMGVLLCDGKTMGRPLEFSENYYMIRPNASTGLLGLEKSQAKVDGLFLTMRGINDMTAFVSLVSHTEKIPPSFLREFQARQLDTTKLREAFYRGTRALPAVFSTTRPL